MIFFFFATTNEGKNRLEGVVFVEFRLSCLFLSFSEKCACTLLAAALLLLPLRLRTPGERRRRQGQQRGQQRRHRAASIVAFDATPRCFASLLRRRRRRQQQPLPSRPPQSPLPRPRRSPLSGTRSRSPTRNGPGEASRSSFAKVRVKLIVFIIFFKFLLSFFRKTSLISFFF